MTAEEANRLFDRLASELYFGFNVRLILLNKVTPEEVGALESFLLKCQRVRMRLINTKAGDDQQ